MPRRPSCVFMLAMFSSVHTTGWTPLSMAAFSAGGPEAPGDGQDLLLLQGEVDRLRGLVGLGNRLGVLARVMKGLGFLGKGLSFLRRVIRLAGRRVLDLLDQERALVGQSRPGGRDDQGKSYQDFPQVFTPFPLLSAF